MPQDIRESLRKQDNPLWDWISNPVDFSISMGDRADSFAVSKLMAKHPAFEMLITFFQGPWRHDPKPFDIDRHMKSSIHHITNKPVVIIFGNRPRGRGKGADELEKILAEIQHRLVKFRLPIYPSISRAAHAVDKMISFYEENRQ